MANWWIFFAAFCIFQLAEATETDIDLTCFDVVCPSRKYKYANCTVGDQERLYNVTLKEKVSRSDCNEEFSYGVYSNSIWVRGGCRAIFNVCVAKPDHRPHSAIEHVLCNNKVGYRTCYDGSLQNKAILDFELIEEHSISTCIRHVTFGVTHNQLWLDDECQGVFSVSTIPECTDIRCSSVNTPVTSCSLPPPYADRQIYSADVLETYSKHSCSKHRYSVEKRSVWVYHGCQAKMRVCTMPDAAECTIVRCVGESENKKYCTVTDSKNKLLVHGIEEKVSDHCTLGESYGFENGGVWVTRPCWGHFKICFFPKKLYLQDHVAEDGEDVIEDKPRTGHCKSRPCQNNGVCTNTDEGYRCECPIDYFGEHCELKNGNCVRVDCSSLTSDVTHCALSNSEKLLAIYPENPDSDDCTHGWTYGHDSGLNSLWVTPSCHGPFTVCYVPNYATCGRSNCRLSETGDHVCKYRSEENVIAVHPMLSGLPKPCQKQRFFQYLNSNFIDRHRCITRTHFCWTSESLACRDVRCSSEYGHIERCHLGRQGRIYHTPTDVSLKEVEPGFHCYKEVNYGYNQGIIWVSNGCSAIFSVCTWD